jgi:HPt (histidine-containing phosphotransfer) domain-containing protein
LPASAEAALPSDDALEPGALQNLRATFGEDLASVLPELIGSFLDSTPQLLSDLQQALQQENVAEVGRKAHTLKSSSAVLGAATLSALCREVEHIAKAGTLEGAAERIAQIEAEYEKVKVALEKIQSEQLMK